MVLLRRQSLRPRQIDHYGKMLIIRSSDDLNVIADHEPVPSPTNSTSSTSHPHQPPSSTSASSTATMQGVVAEEKTLVVKKTKEILIPLNAIVPRYEKDVLADYIIPNSYVRFQDMPPNDNISEDFYPPGAASSKMLEMDLHAEDIKWLKRHPKYGQHADPRKQLSLASFCYMLELLEKASGPIFPHLVSLSEAESIFSRKCHITKSLQNRVGQDVFHYWTARREELQKPLLRRFWLPTPLNDQNPHLVFRPREKERYKLRKHRKNDLDAYRRMSHLRRDFSKTQRLLKAIVRRESAKQLLMHVLQEEYHQTLHDLTNNETIGKPLWDVTTYALPELKKTSVVRHPSTPLLVHQTQDSSSGELNSPSFSTSDQPKRLKKHPTVKQLKPCFMSLPSLERPAVAVSDTHPGEDDLYLSRGRLARGGRWVIDRLAVGVDSEGQEEDGDDTNVVPGVTLPRGVFYEESSLMHGGASEMMMGGRTDTSLSLSIPSASLVSLTPLDILDQDMASVVPVTVASPLSAAFMPRVATPARARTLHAMVSLSSERLEAICAVVDDEESVLSVEAPRRTTEGKGSTYDTVGQRLTARPLKYHVPLFF